MHVNDTVYVPAGPKAPCKRMHSTGIHDIHTGMYMYGHPGSTLPPASHPHPFLPPSTCPVVPPRAPNLPSNPPPPLHPTEQEHRGGDLSNGQAE